MNRFRSLLAGFRASFKNDFLASLVVFLVALPLCMGIAKACGLPLAAGIITGIIGGLLVGTLSGCPLQVSGPAAGLIVVVQDILDEEKGIHLLSLALVLAGAIQLTAGLLKLGQWFRAVSPAVVEGMLAGIGVVIIAKQFHLMVDGRPPLPPGAALAGPKAGILESLVTIPHALADALFPAEGSVNTPWALLLGLLTILVLLLWRPLVPGKLKVLPAAFGAVILAAVAARLLPVPVSTVEPLHNFAQTVGNSPVWPSPAELWPLVDWKLLEYTLTVAFIASAETLLCATAVDQMHKGPRARYDRELWAQGVGNLLCGLLHALPMTGVIVRSKANVEAGGRTRLSAILHGLWLLVFVSVLPWLLELIPVASLAAILVFTGFRLISVHAVQKLRKFGWSEVVIYLITLGGVVVTGLLEGVLIGVVLAAVKLLYTFSHLAIRQEVNASGRRTVLHLEGAATFIRLPKLAAALETVPPNTALHVDFEQLSYIDHACLELLLAWEKQHEATGGSLVIDWESLHARFAQGRPGGNGGSNGKAAAGSREPVQAG
jgi:MFS superfamily sulfate permease-like transporter